MKKRISLLLAALLALSVLSPLASAAGNAPASVWNAEKQTFFLKDGPEIVRLAADSDENGTEAQAYYRHTEDYLTLSDLYNETFNNGSQMFAGALGRPAEETEAECYVIVQFAYSFDGKNWVNASDPYPDEEPNFYFPDSLDLDGDGFEEYRNLPITSVWMDDLFGSVTLFNGREGFMTPHYCDPAPDMSVKQALTLYNNAVLQGKGEYTGSAYKDDDANGSKGFLVDFNRHTLYAKARYRVYTRLCLKNGEDTWADAVYRQTYSDWGPVKTYNNASASSEGQDCVPNMTALNTKAAPTLRLLAKKRYDDGDDENPIKKTTFVFAFRYPEATRKELSKLYALGVTEEREALTGEYYDPSIVYELKVGNGDWFCLDQIGYNSAYFCFDDGVYWFPDMLEALGYRPGDPVRLRARLYGDESSRTEADEKTGVNRVTDADEVFIKTGASNETELNITGKYTVEYVLDGGSFPYGTEQLTLFDEDALLTVDLTGKDYVPQRAHFTFGGWYTTEGFAGGTQIKSFTTAEKTSRTYYAKWTELPFHTVSYDMGAVTDYVYNGNPDRIYPDDGTLEIGDVSYAGAEFLGWFDAPQGGKRVTSLAYASMKGDVTLYAHWKLSAKTIAYAGAGKDYVNNEKNPASFQINPAGSNETLIYAPEKEGFIFDGWFTDADLSHGELAYDKDRGAYLLDADENVTLYAKWIKGRWPIAYVLLLEDAWNGDNPGEYTYGEAVALQPAVRAGYVFDGWYADAAYKTEVKQIKADDSGEKTLYAKWTAVTYKINYDLRDPQADKFFTNPNPGTRTIDDETALQPLAPSVKLYKFLGWYDNVNYDGDPVAKIPKGTDKDVTLYARLCKYSWGDVDLDGKVSSADARLILRCSVNLETIDPDVLAWADVDEPSAQHSITSADARLALRMSVGLDSVESLKLPQAPDGF